MLISKRDKSFQLMMRGGASAGCEVRNVPAKDTMQLLEGEGGVGSMLLGDQLVLSHVSAHTISFASHGNCGSGFISARPASAITPTSKFVLGKLPAGSRVVCCSRQKLWWMGPWVGDPTHGIPVETQFMLCQLCGSDTYALIIPMVVGTCRTSLSGAKGGELLLTTETGCKTLNIDDKV